MAEAPTILVTTADIKKIEHERSLIQSEIALKEAKLRRLSDLEHELCERLAAIHMLLETVGPDTVRRRTSH